MGRYTVIGVIGLRNIVKEPDSTWASEKILVSCHSGFQAILLTEDEFGLRTLRFGADGASQSVVKPGDPRHLALPYARALPACLAFVQNPSRILVLGLGGGSLPRFFHSHFAETTIDVVELDPKVVELAMRHCGFEEDARMHVFVEDGRDFIERSQGRYDLIILDCFGADAIPEHLTTQEFLGHARKALTMGGAVVANIWGPASNPLYGDMLKTYRSIFEDVYILDVPAPGTKLFIALPLRRAMSRSQLFARIEEVTLERAFEYDLIDAMSGFRNSDVETIRGGSILKD